MKGLTLNILVLLLVGILMSGGVSGAVLDRNFNDVKWEALNFLERNNACSGYSITTESGGCKYYRYDAYNGNFIGCDGYTKKGCNDDSDGREICTIESNSPDCSYSVPCTSFTYSAWSDCINGEQTRAIVSSSPSGCSGGPTSILKVDCGDCAEMYSSINYEGMNNTIGLDNGDLKFFCLNNRFYECGWGATANSFAFEAPDNFIVGNYKCDLANSQWVQNTKLNTTYWANMRGLPIESADLEDTVLMVYGGYQLEGKQINFTVQEYNSSSVWWNPFTWFDKDWDSANKISSGNAYEYFKITNDDKKRFVVETGSVENISGNLTIGARDNSEIILNLNSVSPVNNYNASANNPILFSQMAEDNDSLLKVSWDFGDGTSETFYNYSRYINASSANVYHNYVNPGIYHWKLKIQDMEQENSVETNGTIYVFRDGINVFPIISSPERGTIYGGEQLVIFNASKSFVANCSSGVITSPAITTSDGLLNCSYIHAPNSYRDSSLPSSYNLTFTWNFGNGDSRSYMWNFDKYFSIVEFPYKYISSGRKDVVLSIKYED